MNMMTIGSGQRIAIGELARRLGLTTRALRFYDEKELVTAERDAGNRRVYSPAAAKELELVERLRQAGLCLAEIRCALVSGRLQGHETLRVLALQSLRLRQSTLAREAQVVAATLAWIEGRTSISQDLSESAPMAPRKGTGAPLRPSHVR